MSEAVHRVRFVEGEVPEYSLVLVREHTGLDVRKAKELIETRGVVLDQLSLSEARRVAERFNAGRARLEIEPSVIETDDLVQPERSARAPALEAVLRERPYDVDAHLVYGDWLQARGDPRGELIALQAELARANGPAELALEQQDREFRQRHAQRLFGPLHEVTAELVRSWSLGFADELSLGLREHDDRTVPMRLLPQVLDLPIAARMTSLSLATLSLRQRDVDDVLCASEAVACLRTLELRAFEPSALRLIAHESPSLARLWPRLRRLETLIVDCFRPPLRELDIAALQNLTLRIDHSSHLFIDGYVPDQLTVRTLTLDFTSEWPRGRILETLTSRLARLRAEELALASRHPLRVHFVRQLPSFVRTLHARRLDLSGCVAEGEALPQLKELRWRGKLPVEKLRLPRAISP